MQAKSPDAGENRKRPTSNYEAAMSRAKELTNGKANDSKAAIAPEPEQVSPKKGIKAAIDEPPSQPSRKPMAVKSKAAFAQRKSMSPPGQGSPKSYKPSFQVASAKEDIVDPIYKNKDPISTSVKERVDDGGSILSVKRKKKVPFYYTMQLKGPGKEIPASK